MPTTSSRPRQSSYQKVVVCLVSALAFHGLTDRLPQRVWIAIGQKDWAPSQRALQLRIVRFADPLLSTAVETNTIEGVPVRVFGVAKTITDSFRHRRSVCLTVALEGLQEWPSAEEGKFGLDRPTRAVRKRRHYRAPYLAALTANA